MSQCQGCRHNNGQARCAANHERRFYHGHNPECMDRTDSAKAGEPVSRPPDDLGEMEYNDSITGGR